MSQAETRERLLGAAQRLLSAGEKPKTLTARRLAGEAGVNQAMINYCFPSKDALLKLAADRIIEEEFRDAEFAAPEGASPRERLRARLLPVCRAMVRYRDLTLHSIPYLLLQDEITLPQTLLPYLRAHFGPEAGEERCRLAAFQLVYTLQLVFYRGEGFSRYAGMPLETDHDLEALLDLELDLLLGGV